MAQTLTKIRVEYDPKEDRTTITYVDERGHLHRYHTFTPIADVEYDIRVAEAQERLAKQQIKVEIVKAELDDLRLFIEQRRIQLHQQLAGVDSLRALPAPPEIMPPRKPNGR